MKNNLPKFKIYENKKNYLALFPTFSFYLGLTFQILLVLGGNDLFASSRPNLVVGSKAFTESFILGEILAQTIENAGEAEVTRKFGMGGTGFVYKALQKGDIDLYVEYTGTISEAILLDNKLNSIQQIRKKLEEQDLTISDSLGFNNTYALAIRKSLAEKFRLKTISDLSHYPDLKPGLSHEFLKRSDGFWALSEVYGLNYKNPQGMTHSLSYQAMGENEIDFMDVYSTDAKINRYKLVLLEDNLFFFPQYVAVILMKKEVKDLFPETWKALKQLEGSISAAKMRSLNAQVEMEKKDFREVAANFLNSQNALKKQLSPWKNYLLLIKQHLFLVCVSMILSLIIGLPLGIWAAKSKTFSQGLLMLTGVIQTIPSLALLCFMIPLLGIGTRPALLSLFLYGLLPIVKNTQTGIKNIDSRLLEMGKVLGLSSFHRLIKIEFPLAARNILAGIRMSTIMAVGNATLAAFIGAGGFGDLIVTGLALNDNLIILKGAVPSALMAISVHALFEILDKMLIPKALR